MTPGFLHGPALREAIVSVLGGKRRDLAIAFIGREPLERAALEQAEGMRVICDLWSGCCNPVAIRTLHAAGAEIKNLPRLHAKVYIGDESAVVASANWSSNGFGDTHAPQIWGFEAGYRVEGRSAIRPIEDWFAGLHGDALDFDPDDERLDEAWRKRPLRPGTARPAATGSVLRHALLSPGDFEGIGFVFSNGNNDRRVLSENVKHASAAHPDLEEHIARWQANGFTNWENHRDETWPKTFFAYHRGNQGAFSVDALHREIRDRHKGYVLASRDWRGITRTSVPGAKRAAAIQADRSLADRILDLADDGLIFQTARDLADWYGERWGTKGLGPRNRPTGKG